MRLIIAVLLFAPLLAAAETAYVTDNLRLGLHRSADTSDRAFRFLDSGQAMEILTRDRLYANVRLPDGAQGWVKSAYLVDEKPAKLIVAETMAERDALATELEEARAAFAEPAATIEQLRNEASDLTARLETAQAEIAALREEGASVQRLKEQYRGSVPIAWVGGVILVCLVLGFLAAQWWVDYRSRKRHGGIRVY
ncbi:MAG: TIGR04211 family SH3 domain-containing protein [Gammaproteobacteria bacterium]|mgnify:FL=1|nr:TIGR04211 family SH3 domain-containing protein [Gammaproteobacteria bacterium]NNF49382.1 TIGR04211 family SH3 domain-containing protein [Woeseiaceae bacterium]MBT8093545.1 TIGR04211 family SH3 domain-containing protein [Gammaproteobacteria bacterium]MBT8106491.1 TIGR04211 family SH3 domain-containing protein [Gammaproteobacteria bacterium]NNK26506.1 TIGR04211 family SH3 domain-containing protein [Woeseiaceae bacterium]